MFAKIKHKSDDKIMTTKFHHQDKTPIKTVHFGEQVMLMIQQLLTMKINKLDIAKDKANETWNAYMSAGALSRYICCVKKEISTPLLMIIIRDTISQNDYYAL